jgi:hypothetical protein
MNLVIEAKEVIRLGKKGKTGIGWPQLKDEHLKVSRVFTNAVIPLVDVS